MDSLRCSRVIAASVLAFAALPAVAADFPSKPVRLVVPYAPGSTDVQARVVGDKLQQRFGQPFIIENRPGAATLVGAESVAAAPPDGHTLLFTGSTIAGASVLAKDSRVDVERDLAPVSLVAKGGILVATNPLVPSRTLAEFVAYAKQNPGKMNYVSLGGTVLLFGEMFKQQAGIDLVAVPFQGLAPGRTALIRNDVQLIMDGIQSLKPLADEGRIRPLFFTASKRAPSMPGVPSAVEAGLPNFLVGYWLGILAPARTPRDIVAKLSEETARAVATPDLQKHWEAQSWETVGSTPEEFGRWLASERRALAEVMKRANISPQ